MKPDWRRFDLGQPFVGEVGDGWFRVRVGGLNRNAYRPSLVGLFSPTSTGTDIHMRFERPQLWVARIVSLGVMTILPIVFLVGLIGMLAGGHTDQGGSLLPFVLGPAAFAMFYLTLDIGLRSQARGQERRLALFIADIVIRPGRRPPL